MKYPKHNRYLVFERIAEDLFNVRDCFEDEEWEIEERYVNFLKTLDGNTNPYEVDSGMSEEDVWEFLAQAKAEGLLDSGKRIKSMGFGSALLSLWRPTVGSVHRTLGKIWNRLLMITWIPLFVLGVYILLSKSWQYVEWEYGAIPLYIVMFGLSMFFHEISHAAACVGYGGHFFEMGAMLHMFLPGAYVLIDFKNIKNKLKLTQIHAAGIESNFAWAGILLCALKLEIFDSFSLIWAAALSALMGIMNATLIVGIDGYWILQDVFGDDELFHKAFYLLLDSEGRMLLRRKGINGMATIVACCMIVGIQALLPLFVVTSVLEIVSLFR